MDYELETIDYIFDVYDYVVFVLPRHPNEMPIETWESELIPFSPTPSALTEWLAKNWDTSAITYKTEQSSQLVECRWIVSVDFYRGKLGKQKTVEIEGFYSGGGRGIYFTSQSLFLFEFLTKFSADFGVSVPIYISVGTDLHIVEFNRTMELIEFLKEINSHRFRFERD
jgi:hypothetical protein